MNNMDIKEFREFGLLQEVNRLFFHPRGLALIVTIDDEGNETLGEILDYRDEPGGIVFDKLTDENYEKALRVRRLKESMEDERYRLLGYNIQPVCKSDENQMEDGWKL